LFATHQSLQRDCAAIGLRAGDIVMVHASLRAVGPILGAPDVLIDAILETIGPDGTMTMYVGCESPFDDLGRGIYSPTEEQFILEHCPPFDPDTARASREFGALAEIFRTYPGVRCSRHVGARMAAIGRDADALLNPASLNDGHGIGSPLDRLYERGGKVLIIGSDLDEVTLLHYAEARAPIPNKRMVRVKAPLIVDGARTWVDYEELESSVGVREWEERFFAHIMQRVIECHPELVEGPVARGSIGNAASYLCDAVSLVDFAVPIMVATAEAIDRGDPRG
jgi:aminoglycoside 3-N-acetyltransferase